LPTLLSQVLVAFIIEFDNEFEHRMPHSTTNHGSTADSPHAPWLASLVMWPNCMQFVDEKGISISELQRLARTTTNLNGMQRWGYVTITSDGPAKRTNKIHPDSIIRATKAGEKARAIWEPLFGEIENRWRSRFGNGTIERLRRSLWELVKQLDLELPDCLPILGYGLFSRLLDNKREAKTTLKEDRGSHLPLSALVSKPLLAFAIEFEREAHLSLAISGNVLRVLDEKGVRFRDLPLLTGVSKEAISMALGILQKRDMTVAEAERRGAHGKTIGLTAKGLMTQKGCRYLVRSAEERWRSGFGERTIENLREVLEKLVGDASPEQSPLFRGLEPYPDGWRASVRKPKTLPHFPMVLHRGGFPDGS
jgi:hypothetical protein